MVIVVEVVDMDVVFVELVRVENYVFVGINDKEVFVVLVGKWYNGSIDGGFVVVEVDMVENVWFIVDRVDNVDIWCLFVFGFGIVKFFWW